jgi:hypothetical protein
MAFYEKVVKVKADVAAILGSFLSRQTVPFVANQRRAAP